MAKGNILAPVGLSSEAKLVKTDSRVLVCKLSKDEVLSERLLKPSERQAEMPLL